MHSIAIGSSGVTGVSLAVIGVLVVIGVLLGVIIAKTIVRAVIAIVVIGLAVVVALAVVVWLQREDVVDKFDKNRCDLSATYFGIKIQPPGLQDGCRIAG